MKHCKTLFHLIAFGFLFKYSLAEVVYKTLQMQCFPNPEFITNSTCKLKPINWYKSVSNMECDIVKKLRNVSLNLQTFAKNYANQYKPFIINGTGNLCDILDRRRFPAITTIVMTILKPVSNVNHSCPYTGRLIAKDLYLNEQFLPFSLPLGIYKGVFNFYEGYPYRNVGTVTFDVEAKEKQDFQVKKKSGKRGEKSGDKA